MRFDSIHVAFASGARALTLGQLMAQKAYIPNPELDAVTLVDLPNNTTSTLALPAGAQPYAVATTFHRSYVTNVGTNSVAVIENSSNSIRSIIGTGRQPVAVVVSPDAQTVFVANRADGTVSVVDAVALHVVGTIPVGAAPVAMALSSDGLMLFVANRGSNSISIIDAAARKAIDTIYATEPTAIGLSKDGSRLYVAHRQSTPGASIYYLSTYLIKRRRWDPPVRIGRSPTALAVNSDGTRLAVVCDSNFADSAGGHVYILDLTIPSLIGEPISVGSQPRGVGFTADGSWAIIVSAGDKNLKRLALATLRLEGSSVFIGGRPSAFGNFIAPSVSLVADAVQTSNDSGYSNILSATAISSRGWRDLWAIGVSVGGDPLAAASACVPVYSVSSNQLFLFTDRFTRWLGPATPGSTEVITSPECNLIAADTLVTTKGDSMTVSFAVALRNGLEGTRSVAMYAETRDGTRTGWVNRGFLAIPTVRTVTADYFVISPTLSFRRKLTISVGAGDGTASIWASGVSIGELPTSQGQRCTVVYSKSTNQLFLSNPTTGSWLGPVVPGSSAILNNEFCSLHAAGSSVRELERVLGVTVDVEMKRLLGGSRSVYVYGDLVNGSQTGWLWRGFYAFPAQ